MNRLNCPVIGALVLGAVLWCGVVAVLTVLWRVVRG